MVKLNGKQNDRNHNWGEIVTILSFADDSYTCTCEKELEELLQEIDRILQNIYSHKNR